MDVVGAAAVEGVEVAEVERSELSEVFLYFPSYSFLINIRTSWFCTSFGSRDYRQQSGGGQYGGERIICYFMPSITLLVTIIFILCTRSWRRSGRGVWWRRLWRCEIYYYVKVRSSLFCLHTFISLSIGGGGYSGGGYGGEKSRPDTIHLD